MKKTKACFKISSVFRLKYAVIVLLLVPVVRSVWWYYTLPHQERGLVYLPMIWSVVTGFVLGLYGRQSLGRDVILLVLLQTALGLVIHFSASALGKQVDFATLDSWPIFFPVALVSIFLALIGAVCGWIIQAAAKRNKLPSREH